MTAQVFLATCDDLPHGEEEDAALVPALRAAGVEAQWRSWNSPPPWDRPTIIRSTWDYTSRRDAYLEWAQSVPVLFNPSEVVLWNSDKTYLADLADAGHAVTPTEWIAAGGEFAVPPHDEFVVKPSVGAGSQGAGRFRADELDAAREHVAYLHEQGRTAMVQPYLAGVDLDGEAALIYVDGAYSHAITKGAMLPTGVAHRTDAHGLFVRERISARTPSAAERATADAVVAAVETRFGGLLYQRIDLLPTPDGPVVVEVELTEPSLFFGHADGAAERFAAAVAARL